MIRRWCRTAICTVLSTLAVSPLVEGQEPGGQPDHAEHTATAAGQWQFMQDSLVLATFNRQGGPRGGKEFIAPNWWMGMATRNTSRGTVTITGMFSIDPATLGKNGYREIFQVGETLEDGPLVDHQHPHDLFMQLAGVWRIPLAGATGLTFAGGPAGEPSLGPVAFMHRPSAPANSFAPLSHHTFDSTHIAFGVATVALDHGRWTFEGSVFNAREPDEHRWDFDFGALDSVSARIWFRPNERLELQISTGRLKEPERLEPGDVQRTSASGSWLSAGGDDFTAVAAGYGVNATDHGWRHALFAEATKRFGLNSLFARAELLHVETATLAGTDRSNEDRRDAVGALTIGAVREVLRTRIFEGGIGGALTFHAVPQRLTTTHGARPVGFQLFFRLRAPAGTMGRMWNMRMSSGHQ